MAELMRRWNPYLSPAALAALGALAIGLIFISPIKEAKRGVDRAVLSLEEARALLARRPALLVEWESKKNFMSPGGPADSLLNEWVKSLLSSAQSQDLVLEKLEPAGIKTDPAGQSLGVFVSFRGDMRKFVSFAYELLEKDPLSSIESFVMRREEDSRAFYFELLLRKAVS